MRYIGVDLHTTQLTVCYLDNNKTITNVIMIEEIDKFKQSLEPNDQIAVESTSNSNWFYDICKGLVQKITMVNTAQFKVIAKSCNKTDKNDAQILAEFLSKNMLPEAKTKNIKLIELQSMISTRTVLVKQKTMLKNEIHAICVQHGLKIKASLVDSNKGLSSINNLNVTDLAKVNLQIITNTIINLNQQIKLLNTIIEQQGQTLSGYDHLTQIKGLGSLTAIMLLIAIGDINNFESNKKLAAYFGLVPRVRNSNETINHGSITKRGDGKIRSNLVQCALVSIKHNEVLKQFYNKLRASKGHGKAIIATARKLLNLIFYTLKNSWYFTDFVNNEKEIRIINWV